MKAIHQLYQLSLTDVFVASDDDVNDGLVKLMVMFRSQDLGQDWCQCSTNPPIHSEQCHKGRIWPGAEELAQISSRYGSKPQP